MCWDIPTRSTFDAFEPTVDQTVNLTLERMSGNGVHTAPGALEPAIPGCKCLTIAKRSPNTLGTGPMQTFLSAACSLGNQAGCAPVARAAGVCIPRRRNGLEMHPIGGATSKPMTIP